ncbi:MAG TPA: hypothetical protein VMT75_03385, partial [Candidatus Saccharimonadales bacterium]|nr:hypothetical protein [Candidatus Saccharimonadales bacterium]
MCKLQRSWQRILPVLVILLCCGGAWCADDTPALTKEQIKQFLRTAKVINVHSSKKGITNTQRLTLSDGTITHDASFQSIDEHHPVKQLADGQSEIRFVDSYKYNIAAYQLAELVGFDDMMPVYVERKYSGQLGSLSWWLTVKFDEADRLKQKIEPPDQEAWNQQMYKIRVFDELVYDNDPNLTNVLISPDWKIYRIDFTRSFRTHTSLKDPKNLVRCERQMLARLRALNVDEFSARTKGYLTKDEVKAVMARRDIIVSFFDKEVAAKGEAAVLF